MIVIVVILVQYIETIQRYYSELKYTELHRSYMQCVILKRCGLSHLETEKPYVFAISFQLKRGLLNRFSLPFLYRQSQKGRD